MTAPTLTPLEPWVCRRIGAPEGRPLERRDLAAYQLAALNRTLAHARQNSPFYRERLNGMPPRLATLDAVAALPFTTMDDLRRDPMALLCVSRDRIARAVTLQTSGTTGSPKRLFFTMADLERTVDFFHHGMATLVAPGQRVLILLPGALPDSVGDLLAKGLARMAVEGIVHGPVSDPAAAVAAARAAKADALVGIPVQVLAMARHADGPRLAGRIRSVLLTTDHVPGAIVEAIEGAWGCRVFRHYGMTEMGLGGAVECAARRGYHFREADLLVEIVDPRTRQPLPDGRPGEIVFTTLTREGMPLIRYCTGDVAAFRLAPCTCGTTLRTLGAIRGRWCDRIAPGARETLFIGHLDEALFGVPDVLDYRGEIHPAGAGADRLTLFVTACPGAWSDAMAECLRRQALAVPALAEASRESLLHLAVEPDTRGGPPSTGTAKRRIHTRSERNREP